MSNRKYFNYVFIAVVALFLCTASIRPSVQIISVMMLLLLLGYYYYFKLSKQRDQIFVLNKNEIFVFLGFLFMSISIIPSLLVNNSLSVGFRELDIPSKYLLFAIIALLLFKLKPRISSDILMYIIGISGFIFGLIAIFHIFIFPQMLYHGRFTGYIGINETGFICGILSVINASLVLYRKNKLFFLSAGILSFIGVVGSGLRGSLLAVLFSLFVIFVIYCFWNRSSLKLAMKFIIFIVVSFLAITYIVYDKLPTDRIGYTKEELDSISSGNYNTSIGFRLIMYKEALAMFALSPIIGMSAKSQYDNAEKIANISGFNNIVELAKKGPIFGKKHNDILNTLATKGLIGFASLILLYFALTKMILASNSNSIRVAGGGQHLVLLACRTKRRSFKWTYRIYIFCTSFIVYVKYRILQLNNYFLQPLNSFYPFARGRI